MRRVSKFYFLFRDGKEMKVRSDEKFLQDFSNEVKQELAETNDYKVKACVSIETFNCFIEFCRNNNETRGINKENLTQLIKLNEEFQYQPLYQYINSMNIDEDTFLENFNLFLQNINLRRKLADISFDALYRMFVVSQITINDSNSGYEFIKELVTTTNNPDYYMFLTFLNPWEMKKEYIREINSLDSKLVKIPPKFDYQVFLHIFNKINSALYKTREQFEKQNSKIDENQQEIIKEIDKIKKFLEQQKEEINELAQKYKRMKDEIRQNRRMLQEKVHEIQEDYEKKYKMLNDSIKSINEERKEQQKNLEESNNKITKLNTSFNDSNENIQLEISNLKMNSEKEMKNSEEKFKYIGNNVNNISANLLSSAKGILEFLKEQEKSLNDKEFLTILSSRDPYDLLNTIIVEPNDISDNTHYQYFSSNNGNFFLEIIFEQEYEFNGFLLQSTFGDFPKRYEIYIDKTPFYKSQDDEADLNGKYKICSHLKLDPIKGKSFKIVQIGKSFQLTNFFGLGRIEISTTDHTIDDSYHNGLFYSMMKEEKYQKDPHRFPVKIITKDHMTDDIHNQNSEKRVCTCPMLNSTCEIKFLKGSISIDSYRLKFSPLKNFWLQGWKIYGFTKDNRNILIDRVTGYNGNIIIHHANANAHNEKFERIIITNTEKQQNKSGELSEFLDFCHLDFFGSYYSTDSNFSFSNSFAQQWKDTCKILL